MNSRVWNGSGKAQVLRALLRLNWHQRRSLIGHCVNFDPRRFRRLASLPILLAQLELCLQPILQIIPLSTTTLDVDLVCTQLDLLMRRVPLGNRLPAPRSGSSYRTGHDSLLWPEFRSPFLMERSYPSHSLFQAQVWLSAKPAWFLE